MYKAAGIQAGTTEWYSWDVFVVFLRSVGRENNKKEGRGMTDGPCAWKDSRVRPTRSKRKKTAYRMEGRREKGRSERRIVHWAKGRRKKKITWKEGQRKLGWPAPSGLWESGRVDLRKPLDRPFRRMESSSAISCCGLRGGGGGAEVRGLEGDRILDFRRTDQCLQLPRDRPHSPKTLPPDILPLLRSAHTAVLLRRNGGSLGGGESVVLEELRPELTLELVLIVPEPAPVVELCCELFLVGIVASPEIPQTASPEESVLFPLRLTEELPEVFLLPPEHPPEAIRSSFSCCGCCCLLLLLLLLCPRTA